MDENILQHPHRCGNHKYTKKSARIATSKKNMKKLRKSRQRQPKCWQEGKNKSQHEPNNSWDTDKNTGSGTRRQKGRKKNVKKKEKENLSAQFGPHWGRLVLEPPPTPPGKNGKNPTNQKSTRGKPKCGCCLPLLHREKEWYHSFMPKQICKFN